MPDSTPVFRIIATAQVVYIGTTAEDVTLFKQLPEYETFKTQYEQAIDAIIAFSEAQPVTSEITAEQKSDIKTRLIDLKQRIFAAANADAHQFYLAKSSVERIQASLSNPNQLSRLHQLAQEVSLCTPGVCTYLAETAAEFAENSGNFATKIEAIRERIIEANLIQYIQENKSVIVSKLSRIYLQEVGGSREAANQFANNWLAGNNVHVVNELWNVVSVNLALTRRTDINASWYRPDNTDRERLLQRLQLQLTASSFVEILADNCLQRITEAWQAMETNGDRDAYAYADQIRDALIANYGEIPISYLFYFDEKYQVKGLQPDTFKLKIFFALQMTRLPVWQTIKRHFLTAQEINTDTASERTLWQLDDLFWVTKKSEPEEIKRPTWADFQQTDTPISLLGSMNQAQLTSLLSSMTPKDMKDFSAKLAATERSLKNLLIDGFLITLIPGAALTPHQHALLASLLPNMTFNQKMNLHVLEHFPETQSRFFSDVERVTLSTDYLNRHVNQIHNSPFLKELLAQLLLISPQTEDLLFNQFRALTGLSP